VKNFIINISLCSLLLFPGCGRNTPTEPANDGKPPAVPTGLNIYGAADGQVGIEWNRSLEEDVSLYKIYRSTDSLQNYSAIDSTANLYYIDKYLSYDSVYYYKISAVDKFKLESGLTSAVSARPVNKYTPGIPYGIWIHAKNWKDKKEVELGWFPRNESDIDYYNIFRSTTSEFDADSTNLIGSSSTYNFIDSLNLKLLTDYYYKITAVDKGGLTSNPSNVISDELLDAPELIFPENNSDLDYFDNFIIRTSAVPARYKLVIQTNELYGVVKEFNFTGNKNNEEIKIPLRDVTLYSYIKYYWKVYSYTQDGEYPNSVSDIYNFTIVPEN